MKYRCLTVAFLLTSSAGYAQWVDNYDGGFASGLPGLMYGNNTSDRSGDRSRVRIMDRIPGNRTDQQFQLGQETRVRDVSNSLCSVNSAPRVGIGGLFDACRLRSDTDTLNKLITVKGLSIGSQSRASMLCDYWVDGDHPSSEKDLGLIGALGNTGFQEPGPLATQYPGYLTMRTGFASYAIGGGFVINGDNHHFWDAFRSYPKLAIQTAAGVVSRYNSGNTPAKGTDPYASSSDPDSENYSGTPWGFGAHVGTYDGVVVSTDLNATVPELSGRDYDGSYDRIDTWAGVRVKAPTKKMPGGLSNGEQETIATASFGSATGVVIEARKAPGSGADVGPVGYIGLQADAPVVLNDVVKLTPRASAPSSPVEGQIYINSTTNKMSFYVGGSWRQITSTP